MAASAPVLSPRLRLIADIVPPCRCVADIGTDHAYLPVYLIRQGRCQNAIATDLRPGPLKHAEATLMRYLAAEQITLRLGSGAEPLTPGEADTVIVAGMGGMVIGEMLRTGKDVFAAAEQIIFQPMTAVPELRQAILENGFSVREELLAKEDTTLYHILAVAPVPESVPYSAEELVFGRKLMENRPEHFDEYILRMRQKYQTVLKGSALSRTADAAERHNEAERLLEYLSHI